ncbi:hypothetical protein [Serratia bockelmannii]|uniref:hypothetical protein n=1 Tax=Serratia bockelmannii TaxID=2703793 RepID=UPI00313D1ECE
MEHRYTRECPRPDYDEKITAWLKKQRSGIDTMSYPVAIFHEGFIYRSITGSGLGDYVSISEFLKKLGLVNLLGDMDTFRGYDAVYAAPETKAALVQGDFKLADIPRNTPQK